VRRQLATSSAAGVDARSLRMKKKVRKLNTNQGQGADAAAAGEEAAVDPFYKHHVELLTPNDKATRDPRTPEQLARDQAIARRYARESTLHHQAISRQLMQRIRAKQAAILALPEDLRAAALVEDTTPVPWIEAPTWTPPIPNYETSGDAF
jgi:hypothetical protein